MLSFWRTETLTYTSQSSLSTYTFENHWFLHSWTLYICLFIKSNLDYWLEFWQQNNFDRPYFIVQCWWRELPCSHYLQNPDPKDMQINLTGFLNPKNSRIFIQELWELLCSAQDNISGIPAQFVEQKKEEIKKRQVCQFESHCLSYCCFLSYQTFFSIWFIQSWKGPLLI